MGARFISSSASPPSLGRNNNNGKDNDSDNRRVIGIDKKSRDKPSMGTAALSCHVRRRRQNHPLTRSLSTPARTAHSD